MAIKLGAIADDFTGATDLANNLVRAGMRVVQTLGTPDAATDLPDVDAVVVALKSRTVPVDDAVAQSLEALEWLRACGAEQIYFKYCSTFDSTSQGNIGPVTEALMAALGTDFAVATPAFPETGRTIFHGHLFVGDLLLSDSGMRNHPLTPMTDSNLVRVLSAQTKGEVGLIDHATVSRGADSISQRIADLRAAGVSLAIVDAVSNDDLVPLGRAVAGHPLVTAGSGLATALPANWGIQPSPEATDLPPASGRSAIVSGSCSVATNGQVRTFVEAGGPCYSIDPLRLAAGVDVVAEALAFADEHLEEGPVLVRSTEEPAAVRAVQERLGTEAAAALVEGALSAVARRLLDRGVRRLVVAGGETSGAVVQGLGLDRLRIGPQIDPGVPWCAATLDDGDTLHIALKSGNFGSADFFAKAFAQLEPVAS